MKLLFDQNLSHRLVGLLADRFPGSLHVAECGLADADDRMIWSFARDLNYVIASKDSDFSDLSFLFGAPPKAVWVRVGNGPTSAIAELLRSQAARLEAFSASASASFLTTLWCLPSDSNREPAD